MFTVSLCSEVFDPAGALFLRSQASSQISAIARRVSRTATLDGNATIEDNGYSAADSTLQINLKHKSRDEELLLIRLIRLYPALTLCTQFGAYRGVVDNYSPNQNGGAQLRFLVQKQLDA